MKKILIIAALLALTACHDDMAETFSDNSAVLVRY